jgi:hypothetical protein
MLRQIDPPPPTEPTSRPCGNCGYDLRGIAAARCPECGVAFDPDETPLANVPWFHRRTIGRGTALWRTMWLVMLRPRGFAGEVLLRDVRLDLQSARQFRRVCVSVAGVSAALTIALQMRSADSMIGAFVLTLPPLLLYFAVTAPLAESTDFESAGDPGGGRFRALCDFSNAPLLLMSLLPLTVALCRASGRPPTATAALLLAGIVAVWICFKFLYQAWAGGRDVRWLLVQVVSGALVYAFFAMICFALIAYTAAFTNRLFDW